MTFRRRPRLLSSEEKALWDYATADVHRRKPRKADPAPSDPASEALTPDDASGKIVHPPPPKTAKPPRPAPPQNQAAKIPAKPAPPPAERLNAEISGPTPGLDRRTDERFRRGELPLDGHLDLHGMTQEQAHNTLRGFIHRSRQRGSRCLLVITGKGTRGGRGEGILRKALPVWLNEPDLRPHILAFRVARQHHGGSGAFYLLLKRRRDR